MSTTPSFGYDYTNCGVGQSFGLTRLQRLWELRTELNWSPNDKFELIPGIDAIGGYSTFSFEAPIDPQALVEYDPLAAREGIVIEGDGRGWGPDAYIKANIRPARIKVLAASNSWVKIAVASWTKVETS